MLSQFDGLASRKCGTDVKIRYCDTGSYFFELPVTKSLLTFPKYFIKFIACICSVRMGIRFIHKIHKSFRTSLERIETKCFPKLDLYVKETFFEI